MDSRLTDLMYAVTTSQVKTLRDDPGATYEDVKTAGLTALVRETMVMVEPRLEVGTMSPRAPKRGD